jgi:uncharacterized protein YdhG (YjbR/CyaY superfamily)
MKKDSTGFADVDSYIAQQPIEIQETLEQIRQTIRKAAPDAKEVISYQMPAYKLNGMLVYFAAWKNHFGFYPVSSGIAAFKKELAAYEMTKGTVQFPYDKPIPFDLITRIVQFRVRENAEKAKLKDTRKVQKKN